MLRLAVVGIILLVAGRTALAAPADASSAQKAIRGWLRQEVRPLATQLGARIDRAETFTDEQGQALYHIVYLQPSGFVIVPADDEVEPVVGFAAGDTYDPSPENPLAVLIQSDLSARIAAAREGTDLPQEMAGETAGPEGQRRSRAEHKAKWRQLAEEAEAADTPLETAGAASISDVRVAPLVQSRWNQGSISGGYCYNYYTPNHYICGCVATAMAQLMRYHQHPTSSIGVRSFTIKVNDVSQTAYTRGGDGSGGPYNWSQMVLVPGSGITTAQRQAIGALCADAGTTVGMSYKSSGSAASTTTCKTALVNTFGYANAVRTAYGNYSGTGLNNILNSNLDAALPCLLAISTGSTGHSIVADGYGYNLSTTYHHLNMGWSGAEDAWYNLPTVNSYNSVTAVVYNVYPAGTGEIISGRIIDAAGSPLSGVTVTATRTAGGTYTATTNAKGIYAIAKVPANSTYTLLPAKSGLGFTSQNVTTGTSTDGGTSTGNRWGINFTGTVVAAVTVPANPTPANGAVDVPLDAVLSWSACISSSGSPVTYDVYLGQTNPPTALVAAGLTAASYTPAALTAGTTYYWKVVARSGAVEATGPVWHFSTATAPGDITGDGHVTVGDLQALVASWASSSGSGGTWNAEADLNSDGLINVGDLQILVAHWDE